MKKVAVILFPGTNCENETALAVKSAGMDAEIFRWNDKVDKLKSYDGFVLPGGWSYEDRIRAGAIAAKDSVMQTIREQSKLGKPVLGICNGAQVLLETGLAPDINNHHQVEMALAPNINPKIQGYYCTWIYVKIKKTDTAFTSLFEKDAVIPIPIAHGEGRYASADDEIIRKIKENMVFQYCDKEGNVLEKFPINPNGSVFNIAGISNKKGNVVSIMPHPERANWNRQLPGIKTDPEKAAPARKIFESMRTYMEK